MASSPAQLISLIRFQLNQLKVRNGHHEFEHLCRHLTRAKIYSNVIPATGPVGAGGDQGRDFESYATDVDRPSPFCAATSGSRRIIAACSLQDDIETKIRRDIERIVGGGRVDEVLYFCEKDVPVSHRHRLEEWSRDECHVDVQLFDGAAIAEMLSERNTFWIAQEYLHLPWDQAPPPPTDEQWYVERRERWRQRQPDPFNDTDYAEIGEGLAHCVLDPDIRQDLSFWIGLMNRYRQEDVPRSRARSALAQIVISSWLVKRETFPLIDLLRDYFSDLESWRAIWHLQDAETLVAFAHAAWKFGADQIEGSEVFDWRNRLAKCVEAQLSEEDDPGRRSMLLRIRGSVLLVPRDAQTKSSYEDTFESWSRMLADLGRAPLFPIEAFADLLTMLTKFVGSDPRFLEISERVDELVAKRAGRAAAAHKIHDRACIFLEEGDVLAAIEQLHRVQRSWLTAETLNEFQCVMTTLAQCYGQLGLAHAAKYHALAAALLANDSKDIRVASTLPTSLLTAAHADDSCGASLGFIELLIVAIGAALQFADEEVVFAEDGNVWAALDQAGALRGLALRFNSASVEAVDEALGLSENIELPTVVELSVDPEGFWMKGTADDVWAGVESHFLGRPFGDLGSIREIAWRALGIRWSAVFQNDDRATPKVEQMVAELQIAQVALAGIDLGLLPTEVALEVAVVDDLDVVQLGETQTPESCSGILIPVRLPARDLEANEHARQVSLFLLGLMRRTSVFLSNALFDAIEKRLSAALARIIVVRPYVDLFREFVPQRERPLRDAAPKLMPQRAFALREHPALGWFSGLGPGYSRERALETIENRYDVCQSAMGLIVERIIANERVRAHLEGWHRQGIKDWQILVALFDAARTCDARSADEVPTELFTPELLDEMRAAHLIVFLGGWQLVCDPRSDLAAVERFLIARYRLREDDIPHRSIFHWEEQRA